MNSLFSIVPSRAALGLVIFLAALALWSSRQHAISRIRSNLAGARARQSAIQEQSTEASKKLENRRRQVHEENAQANRLRTDARKIADELAQVDPDAAWSEPPRLWPDWNPDSPYVWMRKEMLKQIPFPTFGKEGRLRNEAATILAVAGPALASLNRELEAVLTGYRKLELARAERTEERMSNGPAEEGLKVTVQIPPMPEEGAAAREQFLATLRRSLGQQRSELLEGVGVSWLDSEFSASGAGRKIVSAQRLADGGYSISIQSGQGNRMSVSGPTQLEQYVPPHLLPFFSALQDGAALIEPPQSSSE